LYDQGNQYNSQRTEPDTNWPTDQIQDKKVGIDFGAYSVAVSDCDLFRSARKRSQHGEYDHQTHATRDGVVVRVGVTQATSPTEKMHSKYEPFIGWRGTAKKELVSLATPIGRTLHMEAIPF